jgi:hypothetical protein
MGRCTANFAARVRPHTPSRQVAHMRVTFGRRRSLRTTTTAPAMFLSSFP